MNLERMSIIYITRIVSEVETCLIGPCFWRQQTLVIRFSFPAMLITSEPLVIYLALVLDKDKTFVFLLV